MNTALATAHRDAYFRMISSAGQDITIRAPATRVASTNNVEKILGVSGFQETDYGTTNTVTAWVHQGRVSTGAKFGNMNTNAEILGLVAKSDIVLSLKLEDVLVDITKPYGRTTIDQAKDIQVSGSTFTVVGTYRSGMAPIGPYILWVGLENVGE